MQAEEQPDKTNKIFQNQKSRNQICAGSVAAGWSDVLGEGGGSGLLGARAGSPIPLLGALRK